MHVIVTQEHINAGHRCNAGKCPIALAILTSPELPKWVGKVSVGPEFFSFYTPLGSGPRYVINQNTTEIVRDFIAFYDLGLIVHPMEFDINIPSSNEELERYSA